MLVWSHALLHQGSLLCSHFTILTFISELIEEKEKNKKSSEVEEKNHIKTGETLLSCPQTKPKDFKKRRAKKSFTCTRCGKSYTCKTSLERHMRVHTEEKLSTSDQCGKSFTQSVSLNDHMNIHTREATRMRSVW